MVKRWLSLSRWHVLAVFMLAGIFGILLAFSSFNLFTIGMANLDFLRVHGWVAVMEGGLWQLAGIALNGAFALVCYLGFKFCETELSMRYHRWQDR